MFVNCKVQCRPSCISNNHDQLTRNRVVAKLGCQNGQKEKKGGSLPLKSGGLVSLKLTFFFQIFFNLSQFGLIFEKILKINLSFA